MQAVWPDKYTGQNHTDNVGIFSLPNKIGANRMMLNTKKNIHVGSVTGKYVDKSGICMSICIKLICKVTKKFPFCMSNRNKLSIFATGIITTS